MTFRRRQCALGVAAMAVVVAACSGSPRVEVEQADRIAGPLTPDGQAGFPDAIPDQNSPTAPRPETEIAWGSCEVFDIPDRITAATSGWECGSLLVEMDAYDATPGLPEVELAVTRHRATGDRRGAILINPGGPGAAGLPTAWGIRPIMPTSMLRGFDIVSWDPRGVGQSTPRMDCGGAESFDDGFIASCVAATGPLSGFLSAPYSAADMEALRLALGEPELNFLGFSYGSILGATYAARLPETVGAFVLDGVTDPLAGSAAGPFEGGFAVFADDGRPAALDRLVELCDATQRCLPDADAGAVIDDLAGLVPELPTDDYAGDPQQVARDDYDGLIDTSLVYAGDWELLATALADASIGDASALASVIAGEDQIEGGDDDGSQGDDGDDGSSSIDNFSDANFMIYCADFGPLITEWTFCDEMPVNAQPLEAVQSVDIARPMLVIGTEYDPLTPGKHAPEFAEALGDATHMIWDGVGHTAFPGWTDCIDDAVAAQFLGEVLPPDGTRCTMVEGVTDDAELGDQLFGFEPSEAVSWITDALDFYGSVAGEPACIANDIVPVDPADVDDRLVSHVILDVTSDTATVALTSAESRC